MKRSVFTAAAIVLAAAPAFGSGLLAPITLESAQVMPKGIRTFRVAGFTTEISDKFDGGGNVVPLGKDINRSISLKEMLESQPAGFERGQLKGGIESMGADLGDSIGTTNGAVNTRITSTVPIFAIGVTDKLTFAAVLPVIYSNLNVSTGWTANGTLQNLLDQATAKGLYGKIAAFEPQLQNVIAAKLSMMGYKPLVNETHTDLGDLTMALKYQVAKGDNYAVAITPRVTAPTGRAPDGDKVVDVAGGDGQWDAGVSAAADYIFSGRFTTTAAVGYTYQFERTARLHIPNSWDDTITGDVDNTTTQKFGDIMSTSLGARYVIRKMWTIGAAYSYQYKLPDSYSGAQFSSERYGYLAKDSQQRMQAAQISLSVSTIDAFLNKKFVMPLEATLSFSGILAGQNVPLANLTSLELVSFF